MAAVRIKAGVSGASRKPRPSVILAADHMKRIGETIAAPLRANLAAGLDADGNPLAPESRGDGIPGHETGALAASIKARRTKGGKLVVMPDYRKFRYGIYLAQGVAERGQPPRPFMGMSGPVVEEVAASNAAAFKGWVENIRPATGLSEGRSALSPLPGALR